MKKILLILFMTFMLISCGTDKNLSQELNIENNNQVNTMQEFKSYIEKLFLSVQADDKENIKILLGPDNIERMTLFMKSIQNENETIQMLSENIAMIEDLKNLTYSNNESIYSIELDVGMEMFFEYKNEKFKGYFPSIPSLNQIKFLNTLSNGYILNGYLKGNAEGKVLLNDIEIDVHEGQETVNIFHNLYDLKEDNILKIIINPLTQNEEVSFEYTLNSYKKLNTNNESLVIEKYAETQTINNKKILTIEFKAD